MSNFYIICGEEDKIKTNKIANSMMDTFSKAGLINSNLPQTEASIFLEVFELFEKLSKEQTNQDFFENSFKLCLENPNRQDFFQIIFYFFYQFKNNKDIKINKNLCLEFIKNYKNNDLMIDMEKISLQKKQEELAENYVKIRDILYIIGLGYSIFIKDFLPTETFENPNKLDKRTCNDLISYGNDTNTIILLKKDKEYIRKFFNLLVDNKISNKTSKFYKIMLNDEKLGDQREFVFPNGNKVVLKTWEILLRDCPYPVLTLLKEENLKDVSGDFGFKGVYNYLNFFETIVNTDHKIAQANFNVLFDYLMGNKGADFLKNVLERLNEKIENDFDKTSKLALCLVERIDKIYFLDETFCKNYIERMGSCIFNKHALDGLNAYKSQLNAIILNSNLNKNKHSHKPALL